MADFRPFELGQVLQTAEAIKASRAQATTDRLREQYLGEQIQASRDQRDRQARMDEVVLGREKATQVYRTMQYASRSANPKNFLETQVPDLVANLQKNGVQWETLDDAGVKQMIDGIMAKAGAEAGIAPLDKPSNAYTLKPGEVRFEDGKQVASVAPKPAKQEKAPATWRTLAANELPQYNLPPGTTAQVNDQTRELRVVSKKDTTGALSQKDATTAKLKVNQIGVAINQLDRAMERFSSIKDSFAAGPGSGVLGAASPKRKAFQAAIDQLRNLVTAVQRVPGVGSMSDYETKLQQLVFPDAGELEEVTLQKMNDLKLQLTDVLNGYQNLLSGQGGETVQTADPLGIR